MHSKHNVSTKVKRLDLEWKEYYFAQCNTPFLIIEHVSGSNYFLTTHSIHEIAGLEH